MRCLRRYWALLCLVCALLCGLPFLGCASPAQSVNMIPDTYEVTAKHPGSVKVSIEGGKRTSLIDRSQIANEDFATALEESLRQSGVFATVLHEGNTSYLLEVLMLSLDQPTAGFNMEVKLATQWTLTDTRSQQTLWQKHIIANHTATMGDALAGIARLRLANEGAAKKAIQRGIGELSRLTLPACC